MQSLATYDRYQLQQAYRRRIQRDFAQWHEQHVIATTRNLGADRYDLALPETHALPLVIRPSELVEGVVYGRYQYSQGGHTDIGRGMLVSTNERVLLLDKKPFFIRCEEIPYRAVSGITYSRVWLTGNVILHTKIGDIRLRTFNQHCARNFTQAIEVELLENNRGYPNGNKA